VQRLEYRVREGGFALLSGLPGHGKSTALRIIAERLGAIRDVTVVALDHPECGLSDFYRQMGDAFGVPLTPRNRWGGFKALRERWRAHIDATLIRPVLVVDEAQVVPDNVLLELKHLSSAHFDSRLLLTCILVGDHRLSDRFGAPELVALGTRIRPRLILDAATPAELGDFVRHVLSQAGNPRLLTPGLIDTLCEHACGNYRVLCNTACELLAAGLATEAKQLDEKLNLQLVSTSTEQRRPRVVAKNKEARR
jgi:type II secretory pathway predicted ATPase ExeA